MKIYFGQIYVTPGVTFPFSLQFQQRLSDEITALVVSSDQFTRKYGDDWNLIFRVSAKRAIGDNEIRGPSVFKKSKNVEFTVFLPFDAVHREASIAPSAIKFLLQGVCSVLGSLGINTSKIKARQAALITSISSDSTMFDSEPQTK